MNPLRFLAYVTKNIVLWSPIAIEKLLEQTKIDKEEVKRSLKATVLSAVLRQMETVKSTIKNNREREQFINFAYSVNETLGIIIENNLEEFIEMLVEIRQSMMSSVFEFIFPENDSEEIRNTIAHPIVMKRVEDIVHHHYAKLLTHMEEKNRGQN